MAKELARYEAENGSEVAITDVDVRRVLCDNPNVTDAEMKLFVELCKAHKLNPFIKEAHLVKYGDRPATIVTGKDVFTKRAARNPRFSGYEAGLSLQTPDRRFIRREGSMALPGETIVGGWCKVHIEGYETPMFDEVAFDEYAGKKRDGSLNSQWAEKPGTMIRKVAIVHALREAFPEDFVGLYDSAEMNVEPPTAQEVECIVDQVSDAVSCGEPTEQLEDEPPQEMYENGPYEETF